MKNRKLHELQQFITDTPTFTKKSEVTYLLVEIRKFIEASATQNYPVLKFYCDWTVHTRKDRITPSMKQVIEAIYAEAVKDIKTGWGLGGPNIKKFTYMDSLRDEMREFFKTYKITQKLTENDKNWVIFVKNLVKILEEQPIITPTSAVAEIEFLPAAEGCAIWKMSFNNAINGYTYYRMGNAY